jgi:hypothetical protein
MDADRREALGLAGAILALAALRVPSAQACSGLEPTGRTEIAPGVFESFLTSQEVRLAAYGMLWLTQIAFEPGASVPADLVANDTVVLMNEGLLRVRLDEQEFVLCNAGSMGSLWGFPQGSTLAMANTGADPAVVQVIELLPRS